VEKNTHQAKLQLDRHCKWAEWGALSRYHLMYAPSSHKLPTFLMASSDVIATGCGHLGTIPPNEGMF
jgi:hypothetical protein